MERDREGFERTVAVVAVLAWWLVGAVVRGRQFSAWSTPVNLGPTVNSSFTEHPALSPDGLSLYFATDRPGGHGAHGPLCLPPPLRVSSNPLRPGAPQRRTR